MGIVPENTELSPINPLAEMTSVDGKPYRPGRPGAPVGFASDDEKTLIRPHGRGLCRVLQLHRSRDRPAHRLPRSRPGELDNTLIVVISDNGASGEGGPNGSVNENKFFNGVPDDMADNLRLLDMLGSPETYNHYPTGWAMAFNTPFKMFKRYDLGRRRLPIR